ncbi:hypothetical protein [Streptomyces sp. NBC_00525]|uniref:hypothetical protein n=1 Tax=Streptomyces sp. NBC_00525 TaxID=2903660 RepID=UPI002E808FB8|nr:hypothetical protein [Streptomyces sp. NBC_00525]WUC97400.1 hypothetical protein OG710_28965 [Streptomyces sp. NBC_00525]
METEDIFLAAPLPAPQPTPGCLVCGALMEQWQQTRMPNSPQYDPSLSTDCAVEIGRHPHEVLKQRQKKQRETEENEERARRARRRKN